METKKSRSVKINFMFNGLKSVMLVIFPLISFYYVSRILGVGGVGAVQYSTAIISYFSLFAALGITLYAVREGVQYKNNRQALSKFAGEIFSINLISTVVVYVVLLIMIGLGLFDGYIVLMLVSSLSIGFSTLAIEWLYQINEDYVYISIRTIFIQIISMILLFLCVKEKNDTVVYAAILAFSTGGYCIFNLFSMKKYIDLKLYVNKTLFRHIKSILIMFGTTVASSIYLNLDMVMLGAFYGDYQVGLYSAAVKINVVIRGLINSVSVVVMPRLSLYLMENNIEQYKTLLKKGNKLCMLLGIPSAIGMILISRPLIVLYCGEEFGKAAMASQILAVNMVFAIINNLFYCQILLPHKKEKAGCLGTVLGAALNLAFNAILIPLFVIEGAAAASLVAELAVFVYFVMQTSSIIRVRELFQGTWKYMVASAAIILVVLCAGQSVMMNWFGLTGVIGLAAGLYFVVLWLLKEQLVCRGIQDVRKFIEKKLSKKV